MKLFSALLAITAIPLLPACTGGDDDVGGDTITWRVPCETHGHWNGGEDDTTRITYDLRKHPTAWQTRLADGTISRTVTQVWDGDHLLSADYVGGARSYTSALTYDGDELVRFQRTDRALGDGDDSFTFTYRHDGDGALIAYDVDFADPARDDRRTTVTGNRSTRETDVDCSVADPTQCDTYSWDQPDRNPDHWVAGTADYGTDGTLDYRWDRTIDAHGLDLTSTETMLQAEGPGILQYREVDDREADGTSLGYTYEIFDETGVVTDTYVLASQFTCGAAREAVRAGALVAGSPRAPRVLAADDDDDLAPLPHHHRTPR